MGEDSAKMSKKDVPVTAARRRHARPLELDSEGEEDGREEDSGKVEDSPALSDREEETEKVQQWVVFLNPISHAFPLLYHVIWFKCAFFSIFSAVSMGMMKMMMMKIMKMTQKSGCHLQSEKRRNT